MWILKLNEGPWGGRRDLKDDNKKKAVGESNGVKRNCLGRARTDVGEGSWGEE